MVRLELGDCLDVMRAMEPESVDAIVCDPPYGLSPDGKARTWDDVAALKAAGSGGPRGGFMGREWDSAVPGIEWAAECLRVLKPGGHLVAFASTRTLHRLACAVEDAGFDIRDTVHWCTFQGFPKSLDVSKAIDKAAGAEREVVGEAVTGNARTADGWAGGQTVVPITAPATDAARQWSGWGTALKPAVEPAVLARKPLSGTVAATVLEHGTGALNIDGCRFAFGSLEWVGPCSGPEAIDAKHAGMDVAAYERAPGTALGLSVDPVPLVAASAHPAGRWPANLYHCPKPSTAEREMGTEGLPKRGAHEVTGRGEDSAGQKHARAGATYTEGRANHHPTVKPLGLMRWLCRLVTPPGGVVLDPFMGSGTCGMAAVAEGFGYIGVELEPEYMAIANARIRYAATGLDVESPVAAVEAEQVGLFG